MKFLNLFQQSVFFSEDDFDHTNSLMNTEKLLKSNTEFQKKRFEQIGFKYFVSIKLAFNKDNYSFLFEDVKFDTNKIYILAILFEQYNFIKKEGFTFFQVLKEINDYQNGFPYFSSIVEFFRYTLKIINAPKSSKIEDLYNLFLNFKKKDYKNKFQYSIVYDIEDYCKQNSIDLKDFLYSSFENIFTKEISITLQRHIKDLNMSVVKEIFI